MNSGSVRNFGCRIYDKLEKSWNGPKGHRFAGSFVVLCFIFSILLVEINRFGWIPENLGFLVPNNHLKAIEISLTLLLMIEVLGLVFSIVHSVTTSVGRQLEILSLILLRNVFKEISHVEEPVVWSQLAENISSIIATSTAALFIFFILCIFYRLKIKSDVGKDENDRNSFIYSKKIISLALLVAFHLIIIRSVLAYFTEGNMLDPFESFYTLLIVADVLIVLLSMRYGHSYSVAFRNSGFAVVTVFIRISLISPALYSALIGAGTALFALGILFVYRQYLECGTDKPVKLGG